MSSEKTAILLSVIVPCYNESNHLIEMAKKLSPHLDKTVGRGLWQFVMVSNGSKDNTPSIMKKISEIWSHSLTLNLKRPDYGNALRQGLKAAEGQWAYIINVDFWDSIFLAWAWQNRQGYDLIIGSKRADSDLDRRPRYRKVLSWGLNVLLQLFFGLVATDTHGQKLLNLSTMRMILDESVMSRGQYDTEFTIRSQRAGLKIAEVPVPIIEERKQRNLMLKKIIQNLFDIIRLKMLLKMVPSTAGIHYHRFSRSDMEKIAYK